MTGKGPVRTGVTAVLPRGRERRADTMTGADGIRVFSLPDDRLVQALRKYGRVPAPAQAPAE
ncbi:hypothetical protein ACN28I_18380 [Archangium gephyra]